mmetsp:Transcript_18890/g.40916  ORF Transcript_18890/g.40916 Transcript_18890/m.40916 type:complete len:89 (+) Transcript_18890:10765-11031(+)
MSLLKHKKSSRQLSSPIIPSSLHSLSTNLHRVASDRHQVDTVSVTTAIRKIVAKMCPPNTHSLPTTPQHTYIIPHHLLIPKRRPSVNF